MTYLKNLLTVKIQYYFLFSATQQSLGITHSNIHLPEQLDIYCIYLTINQLILRYYLLYPSIDFYTCAILPSTFFIHSFPVPETPIHPLINLESHPSPDQPIYFLSFNHSYSMSASSIELPFNPLICTPSIHQSSILHTFTIYQSKRFPSVHPSVFYTLLKLVYNHPFFKATLLSSMHPCIYYYPVKGYGVLGPPGQVAIAQAALQYQQSHSTHSTRQCTVSVTVSAYRLW